MNSLDPAFPVTSADKKGYQNGPNTWQFTGLTKREYFAAMALNGLTSNLTDWVSQEFFRNYAEQAFGFADAMIEEAEK